jgi:tripartite-type tricarboxylate transporter receptor subunit TctC
VHTELTRAARAPEVAERLAADGGEAVGGPPEVFQKLITTEIARWRKVVQAANIKVE